MKVPSSHCDGLSSDEIATICDAPERRFSLSQGLPSADPADSLERASTEYKKTSIEREECPNGERRPCQRSLPEPWSHSNYPQYLGFPRGQASLSSVVRAILRTTSRLRCVQDLSSHYRGQSDLPGEWGRSARSRFHRRQRIPALTIRGLGARRRVRSIRQSSIDSSLLVNGEDAPCQVL